MNWMKLCEFDCECPFNNDEILKMHKEFIGKIKSPEQEIAELKAKLAKYEENE